jgi:CubicO group peptidase (beta-lactamase class C family)
LLFQPGTKWLYSDAGPNWLAECVTLAYRRDVDELMFERVFEPLGISRKDLTWRKNAYRPHEIEGIARREFGSGIHANVDAMARIGYLYLRQGKWRDRQIIPVEFVRQASTAQRELAALDELDAKQHGNASSHYGLLWWNNADGTLAELPRDAFWSWGLYDSLIVVVPSLDLVVSRAGASWKRTEGAEHYEVLRPFLTPIAKAVRE